MTALKTDEDHTIRIIASTSIRLPPYSLCIYIYRAPFVSLVQIANDLWPFANVVLQLHQSFSSPSSYSHFYVVSMYDDICLHVARSYILHRPTVPSL